MPITNNRLIDAYDPPANVLEIDILNPETHGIGNKRFTDYEIRIKVSCLLITLLNIFINFI